MLLAAAAFARMREACKLIVCVGGKVLGDSESRKEDTGCVCEREKKRERKLLEEGRKGGKRDCRSKFSRCLQITLI